MYKVNHSMVGKITEQFFLKKMDLEIAMESILDWLLGKVYLEAM